MTRRCSHCANYGHNSRTCPSRGTRSGGVKLFGVRLTDGGSIINKSASMGNLSAHYHSSSSATVSPNPSSPSLDPIHDPLHLPDGYLSNDPAHATSSSNRRA
ncbi:Transcription factor MYBS3 [Camellia lanceoleosa]|uniref:Transcription factor MYBS3 n=1 Tax=Camellia lanceoleosa TaxID=1840588 RepID=A0ACC0I6U9_9ERIC|nr:Transcription factor MYBS3 [Camellia lanceoleosa]